MINTATTSTHLRQHSSTRTQTVPRLMLFASHVIACGRNMVITDHTSMQHYRFRSPHVAEVRQHRHNFDALASTFINTSSKTVPRFMQFASHVIACGRYMVITDHTSTGTITTDRTSMQHYRFRSHVAEVRQHRHNFDALASTFINTCPDCSAFDAIRITCYRMWAIYGHKLSHFDRNHNN